MLRRPAREERQNERLFGPNWAVPRPLGENPHERLENEFSANTSVVRIVRCFRPVAAIHVVCFGSNQSGAIRGHADKFGAARGHQPQGGARESAAASSLSSWNAEGRRSAQSPERGCLRGVLDSRRG